MAYSKIKYVLMFIWMMLALPLLAVNISVAFEEQRPNVVLVGSNLTFSWTYSGDVDKVDVIRFGIVRTTDSGKEISPMLARYIPSTHLIDLKNLKPEPYCENIIWVGDTSTTDPTAAFKMVNISMQAHRQLFGVALFAGYDGSTKTSQIRNQLFLSDHGRSPHCILWESKAGADKPIPFDGVPFYLVGTRKTKACLNYGVLKSKRMEAPCVVPISTTRPPLLTTTQPPIVPTNPVTPLPTSPPTPTLSPSKEASYTTKAPPVTTTSPVTPQPTYPPAPLPQPPQPNTTQLPTVPPTTNSASTTPVPMKIIIPGEVSCDVPLRKMGCYKDDQKSPRSLPELVLTDRDGASKVYTGGEIDWQNWINYLPDLVCRCALKAKSEGYKFFGIQYYGECWSGPSEDENKFKRNGLSPDCVDTKFKSPCDDDSKQACAGKQNANYVYSIE